MASRLTWITVLLVGLLATVVLLAGGVLEEPRADLGPDQALGQTGTVLDVTDFGAVADGETNATDSIQEALDQAGPGDTVFLPAGTYVVDTLTVEGGRGLAIAGEGPQTLLLSDSDRILVLTEVRDLEVRDMAMDGYYEGRPDAIGIHMQDVRDSTFDGVRLVDMGFAAVFGVATDTVFRDMDIENAGDFGIQTKPGSARVTVEDSSFADFASRQYPAHAIYFEGTTDPVARGNYITGVDDAPGMFEVSGIKVTDGRGGLVEDNVIEDSFAAVSLPHVSGVTVRDNIARRMEARGFYILAGSTDCVLESNLVEGAPVGFTSGHWSSWPDRITLRDNVVEDVGIPVRPGPITNLTMVGNSWQ